MASIAAVMNDAPSPLDGTSFDPYGQLLRMLLPRAHSIVIYDRLGVSVWASENDDLELQRHQSEQGLMRHVRQLHTGVCDHAHRLLQRLDALRRSGGRVSHDLARGPAKLAGLAGQELLLLTHELFDFVDHCRHLR